MKEQRTGRIGEARIDAHERSLWTACAKVKLACGKRQCTSPTGPGLFDPERAGAPPAWPVIEQKVEALFEWLESGKEKGEGADDPWIHPVIQAGILQHRLVYIHPFLDGNGRTARMMTTLLLYQRGYDFKFLFELSEYYNRDRDEYNARLRTADRSGDYTEWLEYFLGGFSHQMFRIEERVKKKGAIWPRLRIARQTTRTW
jgi:Fic family protein